MLASIRSAVLLGAEGHPVTVEVHVHKGLPSFHLVGLPDESVRESRDRVRAAVQSSGHLWPDKKITVNLAPSQERKTGSGLDLAIAVGVLVAMGDIDPEAVEGVAMLGELGLDGSLRPVRGIAPLAGVLADHEVVVPQRSAGEAAVAAPRVRPIDRLDELTAALCGEEPWPQRCAPPPVADDPDEVRLDLADVAGQPVARHALEIAAAGGHHLLFVGPPGAGKTMLAARLPGLLPPLDRDQALSATMVHSAAGVRLPPGGLVRRPPFRSPHHTSTVVSLVGGGSHSLRPGELSLAHCGVLFLDEVGEFPPKVLDALRTPLEERVVHVARANLRVTLPADVLLVAALNPCPCGGGPPGQCVCTPAAMRRYASRVSGPILDRFDLRVNVHRPAIDDVLSGAPGECTEVVAGRVAAARRVALGRQGCRNADLGGAALNEFAPLDEDAENLLRHEMEVDRLTGRGLYRIRRVARTIADLRGGDGPITLADVSLALRIRAPFDPAFRGGRAA